jgi:hypothetical protein
MDVTDKFKNLIVLPLWSVAPTHYSELWVRPKFGRDKMNTERILITSIELNHDCRMFGQYISLK